MASQQAASEADFVSQQINVALVEKNDDIEDAFKQIKESYNTKQNLVKPVKDHHKIDLTALEATYWQFISNGISEIEELDQKLVIEGNEYCTPERIKKQMVIQKRLGEIRPLVEEHELIGHLKETFDQSDFFIRMQRNLSFWKAVDHPGLTAETLWNNYRRSFRQKFLSWLSPRDGGALRIPCPPKAERFTIWPLHDRIFNRDYFTLER